MEMKINKIFLLDDDPIVNIINEQLFRKFNASKQYIVCRTSQEAVDYINSANPLPEIVIIDLNIPLINGFDFLDKFYDKFLNNLSVYILTSSINPIDYNKAMGYPFVKGYLKKPLTRDIVQKIIAEN
jgi:response regulator of citrate/malate metabolism